MVFLYIYLEYYKLYVARSQNVEIFARLYTVVQLSAACVYEPAANLLNAYRSCSTLSRATEITCMPTCDRER